LDPMALLSAYTDYRQSLHASPETVAAIRKGVGHWVRWADPTHATRSDVERYLYTLRHLSPATRRLRITLCRGFHAWLVEHGYRKDNPWERIPHPRMPKRVVRVLSAQEIGCIDSSLRDDSPVYLRDAAMYLFLRDTGCRIGELLGMDVDDVDLDKCSALVTGKGNKERVVFFSDQSASYIRRWLEVGRPQFRRGSSGPLWVTYRGKRVGYTTAHRSISLLIQRSGIGRHVTPHMLRHTFGTHGAKSIPLHILKELMGHETIRSTERYLHVYGEDLRSYYRKATGWLRGGDGR
jgi:site-specific recombinase XerD